MKKSKLLIGLCALTAVIGLAACDNSEEPPAGDDPIVEATEYTVTFNSQEGSAVSAQKVKEGEKVKEPTAPTREGYTFKGWYKEASCTNAWNFGSDTVSGAVTLYAKWEKKPEEQKETFNVYFHLTATDEPEPVTVEKDDVVAEPTAPTKPYSTFVGWFTSATEQNENTAFSFSTPITQETHLYAGWTVEKETVTYTFDAATLTPQVLSEDLTVGKFTIGAGNEIRTESGKKYAGTSYAMGVKINNSGQTFTVHSAGEGKLVLFVIDRGSLSAISIKQPDGTTVNQEISFENVPADTKQMQRIEIDVQEGDYVLSQGTGTPDIAYATLTCQVEKSAPKAIKLSGAQTKFLQGREFDASTLNVELLYENGRLDMLDKATYTVDSTAFNKAVAGSYTIQVTFGELTETYVVYVYGIESIQLYDFSLDSKRNTLPLQKVFLKDSQFNSNNLAVHATGKTPNVEGTEDFILTAEEIEVVAPLLTAVGQQTITVKEKLSGAEKSASYSVVVVTNVFDASATSYKVTVDTTADAPVVENGLVVFKTINDALMYLELVQAKPSAIKTIEVAVGTYFEKVTVNMPNVHMVGIDEDASRTVLEFNALNGLTDPSGTITYSTNGSASITITETATGFTAQNITFKNYYNTNALYEESKLIAGSGTQAVAALVQADQSVFKNVRFTSYHDTLYAQVGRQYYENCYIEGRTDYIFGYNATAFFENCNIHTLGAGVEEKNGGYVIATKGSNKAAATDAIKYGYIFNNCTFDADDQTQDGSVSIARGWDVSMATMIMNSSISKAFSKTAYVENNSGLNNRYGKMNAAPVAAQLLEYNNTGDGAITESLENTCTYTTEAVALEYADLNTVFGAVNNKLTWNSAWNPVQVKDATIVLKKADGTTLQTLENVGYVGATITEVELRELVEIPSGMNLDGFFTNAECTTAYNFATKLTESNEIYVKLSSSSVLSATTIKFSGLAATIDSEVKVDALGIVTLVGSATSKITVDGSGKEILDAEGNAYTPEQRVKTGGQSKADGRYIKIDLSKYSGQAKIQIYSQTGSGAADRTGQLRKDAFDGASVLVINCPAGSAATLNEVVIECGHIYYITADASINFFGINIIPVV